MGTYISPEQRAKILSAIKDEGMPIIDAAKTYLVTEKTIRGWMRKQSRNSHTSSTEVQRLKQENALLKEVIGEMILHQKMKKKASFLSA
jgi:transposase-like protein